VRSEFVSQRTMKKPHRPERESAAGAASGQFDDSPRRPVWRAAVARISRPRWIAATLGVLSVAAIGAWFVWVHRGQSLWAVSFLADRKFLKHWLRGLGPLAPVAFIVIQALQVIVSPIPGDVTGFLGGYLFGEWLGVIYSTVGLTLGSVGAFLVGRWLGGEFIQRLVSPETWARLGFLIEAEGAVLCFVVFLLPGVPKDVACYLFGMSPIPLWLFALASTVGRLPTTWVLSAEGARTEAGNYIQLLLFAAAAVAVGLPLFYYRARIVRAFQPQGRRSKK
jgi:uncharacterized membrane protein YdjX (TVP38/TMEM64 family)